MKVTSQFSGYGLETTLTLFQPVVSTSRSSSINAERSIRQAHIEEDEHGNQRIVDENGVVVRLCFVQLTYGNLEWYLKLLFRSKRQMVKFLCKSKIMKT